MFENTRFSDIDEAIIRILDILASVADITEPRNYSFVLEPESSTFKSIKNKKSKSKIIDSKRKFCYPFMCLLLFLFVCY